MVFRARCCSPIRGEKIVGYVTRGKGVSVHSATCPNVVNLLYDPGAAHRRGVGQERRRRALHRQADDGGRGPEGIAGGGQRQDRRHQHEHQEHGSAHRRRRRHARIDVTIEISDLKHLEKVIKSLQWSRRGAGCGKGRKGWIGRKGGRGMEGREVSRPAVPAYPAVPASRLSLVTRDHIDLYPCVLRKSGDLDGRASRIGF